ncbi:MAG: hypothetical protein FJW86_08195 [Actinobacteria bacterium]|nr:hypothetical protein [Actinomycetota bacterium]
MKRAVLMLVLTTALVTALAVSPAWSGQDDPGAGVIVLNGQGNDLDAYTGNEPFKHQLVIQNHSEDPNGRDINAQICFFPDGKTFIAGEDTGQPDPVQGWGIFKMKGTKVGKLKTKQIGKLQPTYQGASDNAENYGCGILSDGRVVTSDIGNQASGPENGQLIIWFPPFTAGFEELDDGSNGTNGDVPFCKLDIAIGTAGSIQIDDEDRILISSARGATTGVTRYTGPFPTSDDAEGGCGQTDSTGAPMADSVTKEKFITTENELATPNGLAPTGDGGWYVASVANGLINEYDADGQFVRTILRPPAGEGLGPERISTGTPLGMGVAPDGTIYFADIGIVIDGTRIGPGDGTGRVFRITFVDGEPQPPEVMADGLAFPDGIGIYVPKKK